MPRLKSLLSIARHSRNFFAVASAAVSAVFFESVAVAAAVAAFGSTAACIADLCVAAAFCCRTMTVVELLRVGQGAPLRISSLLGTAGGRGGGYRGCRLLT